MLFATNLLGYEQNFPHICCCCHSFTELHSQVAFASVVSNCPFLPHPDFFQLVIAFCQFFFYLQLFFFYFFNKGQCTAPRIDTSKHRNLVRLFDHDNFYLLRITVWSLAELKNCVVDVMMVCMGDSLRESKVRDVVDKFRLM